MVLVIVNAWFRLCVDYDLEVLPEKQTYEKRTKREDRPLIIHVYGGSITAAKYITQNASYASLLEVKLWEEHNINAKVHNNGISASGPQHWILCGTAYADIVISEFRINEQNTHTLKDWYDLLSQNVTANRVVVLDLWSWLVPPGPPAATVKVLHREGFLKGGNSSKFSLTDTSAMDAGNWRTMVTDGFVYDTIPTRCYQSALERNQTEVQTIAQCREQVKGQMQHGTEKYHERVANLLTDHIVHHVLPTMNVQTSKLVETAKPNDGASQKPDRFCVGKWGGLVSDTGLPWDTPGIILNNTGFHLNCDTSNRTDKVTLNTNASFADTASIVISCPQGYTHLSLGIYKKSNRHEQATCTINGKAASSASQAPSDWRLRFYSKAFKDLPITISNVVLASPSAYLEFTDIACLRNSAE